MAKAPAPAPCTSPTADCLGLLDLEWDSPWNIRPSVYPQEHLYVMVNAKLASKECKETNMDEKTPDGEEEDDNDDSDPITEVRFVPMDKTALGPLFTALCDCWALHPDPGDTDSENDFEEDDEEGEEYDVEAHERGQGDVPTFHTYEEGFSHLNPEGQATLQRLERHVSSVSQSTGLSYGWGADRIFSSQH
ncbi:hypothetical protein scyTo_0007412 [Scyliorhinus torazame]|uniref:Methylosome subunit pICln n=1 Tax=Scyliorhinus torazame TaxID=75743 RepID=A0A401NRU8_SCYTO|nr:hypothetical protein [Scyliorhinus torazame]